MAAEKDMTAPSLVHVQMNEQALFAHVDKLVEQRMNEVVLPRTLAISISDVKRITGISHPDTLNKILADPRILQHQFRLNEGGHRRWNAKGFEEAFEDIINDLKAL
ncbi:hypothetical protein [Kurthia sp. Dielmo]|uniref:hypothetical protein n=1 Tax=Kurthia sp. Dielmo TaxID=1033738 RepID=UPI00111CD848|nr:hypothetical protein [Kurthia sp. Dielmo]